MLKGDACKDRMCMGRYINGAGSSVRSFGCCFVCADAGVGGSSSTQGDGWLKYPSSRD
jgi:hypothetical protein